MKGTDAAEAIVPQEAALPELIRDLLRKRGLTEQAQIDAFLQPSYEADLADPFLMADMEKAVDRLVQAIERKEKVAVYGDYDIDGVVSTALMLEVLEEHGLEPISFIPDRFEEGYGLHTANLQQLKDQDVTLVVSVDCGITAVEEASWARENGLDLIITDHHEAPEVLPRAVAVVNPRRADDAYPFKDLAGVGVAFAVARALQQRTGVPEAGKEKWLLDLVAMGTVCDVMPLIGENRCLVKYGLVVLRKTKRVGLVALAQAAGMNLSEAKTYHLGFIIGPRMNAAGRLEHATQALELLLTKDPVEAQRLAYVLEELNNQRQLDQARITAEADALAESFGSDATLVLADPSWSHGVVGIVASKLAEKWQKPTLVLQQMGDTVKGSGRSANGYNLIDGLRAREDLFSSLGGHHHAAGFTLPAANVPALREHLNAHYASVESTLSPKTAREAELILDSLMPITMELHAALEELEPHGSGNPQPSFGAMKLKVIDVNQVGKTKEHLKIRLADESGMVYEAMGFGLAPKYSNLRSGQLVDIVFLLEKNQWNDRTYLQFVILSIA